MRRIIVDGYNVIHADPRLQPLENTDLERARDVLVQTLASSPRLVADRIMVVFDGARGSRPHVHSHRVGRVEVVFSGRGQTADDVIVAQARGLARRERVVVVTNDLDVRGRCRAEGCELSSSENLLQQVPGKKIEHRMVTEPPGDEPSLSTVKRGNPRRQSKRARRQRDFRF